MKLENRPLGFAYALLAVTIWSGNFILASGLADTIPPIALAALRWSCAVVVFLPFAWRHLRRDWPAIRSHKLSLAVAAVTGVSLFNTLVYLSAHTTDTVNMALIASTTPVFVVVLSRIFLGEPISRLRAAGLVVAIAGMAVIATRGSLHILLDLTFREGDLWMVFAGLLWAVYSILVKRKPPEISQHSYLAVIFMAGAIPLIPAAFLEQPYYPAWSLTPAIIGATLYIGVGASLAAFFLWNSAIMAIGPGTASLFQYFIPVFSGIGAYFLIGQPITVAHIIGFVLIFSGVFLATRLQ
ncbi:MAG: DMT family transporter [Desulfovibrionaceae bacterium]|nr:DMT family transporter [Desulfovibrionaceae bacterium]